MFSRKSKDGLLARLAAVEAEMRDLRREAAEQRAAHDDAIDLALITAVPNTIHRAIGEARAHGWLITYSRASRQEMFGTIHLRHPTEDAHDYGIDLPLPDDRMAHRHTESEIVMRIRGSQAA